MTAFVVLSNRKVSVDSHDLALPWSNVKNAAEYPAIVTEAHSFTFYLILPYPVHGDKF